MAEYNLPQALDFAQLAIDGLEKNVDDGGVRARNGLYLAHLSIEIALKAVLEQAGMPVNQIRGMSHNLQKLSSAVGSCSFKYVSDQGESQGQCSVIRDLKVTKDGDYLNFGRFVDATTWASFSSYPGELRYGPDVKHFDPEMVAQLARELCRWLGARAHTFSQC